jgi:uncharacterized damage-inducible protein DinB
MATGASDDLIDLNLTWLRQAAALLDRLEDRIFATSPPGMAPHRVGGHLRHLLEFYECFLDGVEPGRNGARRIDYDRRRRDELVERDRRWAAARIQSIIRRLSTLKCSRIEPVAVRVESGDAEEWLESSIGRELQGLSSHTIHHFALIAMTLRLHGVEIDADFGMSPSTLRYLAAKSREAA